MALTRAAKIEAAATIMEMMMAGESDDSIMAVLGMDAETFYDAKRFMLETKVAELRGRSPAHVYVEYLLDQKGNIRLVDNMLTKLDSPTAGGRMHYNAFVGAVRLRADITDRILDRGFDLGMIRKSSGQVDVNPGAGKIVGMTDGELREAIASMVKSTADLVEMGDVDLMSVEAGPTHTGPGLIDGMAEDDEAELDAPPDAPAPPPPAPRPKPAPKPAAKPAARAPMEEIKRRVRTVTEPPAPAPGSPVVVVRKKAVAPPAPPAKPSR